MDIVLFLQQKAEGRVKIALVGYGKMGRQVEIAALKRGHNIVALCTSSHWDETGLQQADVCIDFTCPDSALKNACRLASLKKKVVIGTTGWYEQLDMLQAAVLQHGTAALYGANFSLGIQLFLELAAHAGQLMAKFPGYDAAGIEYHHSQKKDSPSGTAMEIGKAVTQNIERIPFLPWSSVRCGSIPGTHSLLFDSPCDSISLTHTARNRDGFAEGAVLAAEWLQDKTGIYTFADCVKQSIFPKKSN